MGHPVTASGASFAVSELSESLQKGNLLAAGQNGSESAQAATVNPAAIGRVHFLVVNYGTMS